MDGNKTACCKVVVRVLLKKDKDVFPLDFTVECLSYTASNDVRARV